jgi:nucleotide-binding universal stress UspA family protein
VDGSETSKLGLHHAIGLAKEQRARVRVLNVLDDLAMATMDEGYPVDMTRFMESMRKAGKKALDEGAALAEKAGVSASTAMVETHGRRVSDVILADAKTFRADLIVMGTHGRRGLNRLLLGSDAERVLHDAPVPVLLIRAQQPKRRTTRTGERRR